MSTKCQAVNCQMFATLVGMDNVNS